MPMICVEKYRASLTLFQAKGVCGTLLRLPPVSYLPRARVKLVRIAGFSALGNEVRSVPMGSQAWSCSSLPTMIDCLFPLLAGMW